MINGRSKIRKPKPATSPPPPPNAKTLMSIMARKSSMLKQTLATFVVALIIYGLFSVFLNRTETSKLDSSLPLSSTTSASVVLNEVTSPRNFRSVSKVKIYMYDLPKRFTFGVIQHHSLARGGKPVDDVTGLKYPGHQHMAEWYLFKDFMKPDSERDDSPVVRVMDAEEADLFYVPFFSSLSLIVNPIRPATEMKERPVYSDEENQDALVEWLEEQQYWKRNNGRDHVIIAQDPNALYKVIDRLKNSVLLVSDFGRLRPQQASLVKDIILPYSHRINTYTGDVGIENRPTLLFFMGNRYRKEGGKIRDILFQILENDIDVIIKHGTQSRESRRAASHGMHTSRFCLNPAGDTPSACRLFDSIVSLCVPVIISNSIELPFEDVIDYRKIAIFVDSEAAIKPGYLLKMLHAIRPGRILEYQRELKEVKRFFEYEETHGTVNQIWRQVSQKLPLIKLMVNRDKRLIGKDIDCSCICSNKTEMRTSL